MYILIITLEEAMYSRGMRGQGESFHGERERNINGVTYNVFMCGILKMLKFEIKDKTS